MKTFRRILFNALVAQSLLLGVATIVLWLRSYNVGDVLIVSFYSSSPLNEVASTDDLKRVQYRTFGFGGVSGCGGLDLKVFSKQSQVPFWDDRSWDYLYVPFRPPVYPFESPRSFVPSSGYLVRWKGFGYLRDIGSREKGFDTPSAYTAFEFWFPAWFALLLCTIFPTIWLVWWYRTRRFMISRKVAETPRE